MKTFSFTLISLLLGSGLFSNSLYAQNVQYISDAMTVPLRTGPTTRYRISNNLKVGTRLTVLEVSEDGTFSKVRTYRGTEGWVRTQHLTSKPAAKDLLTTANKHVSQLKASQQELKAELAELKKSKQNTDKDLKQMSVSHDKVSQQLTEIKTISGRALELDRDNDRLLHENEALKNELDVLKADNQRLSDEADSDAFMSGAFAVLLGVLITLLIPRMMPKKKTEWG